MTKAFKFIISVALALIFIACFLWVNYNDFKKIIPKRQKDIVVYCTEYETKNTKFQTYVKEINAF